MTDRYEPNGPHNLHPDPCPDCDCRRFTIVWRLAFPEEMPDDYEAGGPNKAPFLYRCDDCGTEQQVREDPGA